MHHPVKFMAAALTALALAGCGSTRSDDVGGASAASGNGWTGVWATAPYGPYPLGPLTEVVPVPVALPVPSYFPNDHAKDQSLRMIVHPTAGGTALRVRLSNLVGEVPVTLTPVRIAKSLGLTGPAVMPGTDTPLTFGGQASVTIAPGAEVISDAAPFDFAVGDDLAISFHVVGETGSITWHAVSFGPNYVGLPGTGDTTADFSGVTFTQPSLGWFFISGLDALTPNSTGSIVALGDSITDGAYTVVNTRWTDWFAQRLRDAGVTMGVLNEGINSNTVTEAGVDPSSGYQGPPAVDRFTRDVLQRSGVRSLVILEGTNDLSAGVSADEVYTGIRSMVARAHAAGLCVVVGTIMPRGSTPIFPWPADAETQRQKLNPMLLAQTDVEGIADFAAAMASPLDPNQPNLALYAPDLLHPTPVGTLVMANAVPLEALVPPPVGRCAR